MGKYYNVHYENGGDVTFMETDDGWFDYAGFRRVREEMVYEEQKAGIFGDRTKTVRMKGLVDCKTYVMEKDQKFYDIITGEEVFSFDELEKAREQDKLGFCREKKVDAKTLANELRKLKPTDIERYIQQFERAKQNAKKEYEKYLKEQQLLREDENFIEAFHKKLTKTR